MRRFILGSAHFLVVGVLGASEFLNLGFDEADLSGLTSLPDGRRFGEIGKLLPGWSVNAESPYKVTSIWYSPNGIGDLSGFGVTLGRSLEGEAQVHGVFGIGISNAQLVDGRVISVPISISQKGRIPENAEALRFYYGNSASPPSVSINGIEVNKTSYYPDDPFHYFETNVRAFAGNDVEIQFDFPGKRGGVASAFDVIGFTVVPEPDVESVLLCGTVVFFAIHLYRRREKSWKC